MMAVVNLKPGSNWKTYEGEMRQGKKNGYGVAKNDYESYEGHWKDDKMHGNGVHRISNGDVYEGQFENGQMCGFGKYTWLNGAVYEGEMENNWKHGKGIWKFANGTVYDGYFKNNKHDGYGQNRYYNGDSYDGQWKNGKKHGYGVYKYKNGKVYAGLWNHGAKLGNVTKLKSEKDSLELELAKSRSENESLREQMKVIETENAVLNQKLIQKDIKIKHLEECDEKKEEQKEDAGVLEMLLSDWGLQMYADELINKNGFDDIEDWKGITEDELIKNMNFKIGHARKFMRKVKDYFELLQEPSHDQKENMLDIE